MDWFLLRPSLTRTTSAGFLSRFSKDIGQRASKWVTLGCTKPNHDKQVMSFQVLTWFIGNALDHSLHSVLIPDKDPNSTLLGICKGSILCSTLGAELQTFFPFSRILTFGGES